MNVTCSPHDIAKNCSFDVKHFNLKWNSVIQVCCHQYVHKYFRIKQINCQLLCDTVNLQGDYNHTITCMSDVEHTI
jgi:hypothetical protein